MHEIIIETKGLTKSYRGMGVVKEMDLTIEKGKIYGLIGKNGAGKTTLIRMLAGLISKTEGEIAFYGSSLEKDLVGSRKKFSFIVETPYYVPEMNAYENLNLQRLQKGIKDVSCIESALRFVGLQDTGNKLAKNFSLGMRQRLGIAIALLTDVEVLVLDEPTNGLDPEGIIEIRTLIEKLNKEKGITVLISSHILAELSKLVTDYIFMDHGKLLKQTSAKDLQHECQKSYTLTSSNQEEALKVLHKHLDEDKFYLSNQKIIILVEESKMKELSHVLCKAGVCIYELFESTIGLEEYYIKMLEGEMK